jgi:transcription elongation factor GreA
MEQKQPMTEKGYNKLSNEIKDLKLVQRPAIIIAVDEARQLGDLKENAEYHAAKDKQRLIDKRLTELSTIILQAQIIDPAKLTHERISFGSTVDLVDINTDEEITYTIVGDVETDVNNNVISINSPLAKQLLSKEEGEEVTVTLPSGKKVFEIEKIYYKAF